MQSEQPKISAKRAGVKDRCRVSRAGHMSFTSICYRCTTESPEFMRCLCGKLLFRVRGRIVGFPPARPRGTSSRQYEALVLTVSSTPATRSGCQRLEPPAKGKAEAEAAWFAGREFAKVVVLKAACMKHCSSFARARKGKQLDSTLNWMRGFSGGLVVGQQKAPVFGSFTRSKSVSTHTEEDLRCENAATGELNCLRRWRERCEMDGFTSI